jgi:hypothetical protein
MRRAETLLYLLGGRDPQQRFTRRPAPGAARFEARNLLALAFLYERRLEDLLALRALPLDRGKLHGGRVSDRVDGLGVGVAVRPVRSIASSTIAVDVDRLPSAPGGWSRRRWSEEIEGFDRLGNSA